jgi:DNA-binding CsgD family transcriptional regulator
MNMPVKEAQWALSEKEKQTLRLIVRGHDAKSTARSLGLSVHTINERLRDARRKMAVSSSREAARLLLEVEGGGVGPPNPELFGDMGIGEDRAGLRVDQATAPISGAGRAYRPAWIITGVLLMICVFGLLALAALPQVASEPPAMAAQSDAASRSDVANTARQWLALLDEGRWDESYQATGATFRKANTLQVWAAVSEKVRTPLGAAITRTFLSQENLPAPPRGNEVENFRTRIANKHGAGETVTLDREDDGWRVVGVTMG